METTPAPKSSLAGSRPRSSQSATRSSTAGSPVGWTDNGEAGRASRAGAGDGLAAPAEQLVNRVIKPLRLVVLARELIEELLDAAAERGPMTHSEANDLATELREARECERRRANRKSVLAAIDRALACA
jgi:hypothetical protein